MTPVGVALPAAQHPFCIRLPSGPAATTQARRHIWAIVHTWDLPIDAYAAALLTSDLVTEIRSRDENAAVELMISWVDSQFRVEVRDVSSPWPGGRGLRAAPGRPGLALAVNARRSLRIWPRQDR